MLSLYPSMFWHKYNKTTIVTHLDETPFQYDIPLCMGIEGACMTTSISAILGWVELEIDVPSLGLVTVKLWVADTVSSNCTPFIHFWQ